MPSMLLQFIWEALKSTQTLFYSWYQMSNKDRHLCWLISMTYIIH